MHLALFALLACSTAPPVAPPAPEPTPESPEHEPHPVPDATPDPRAGIHVEPHAIIWDADEQNLSVDVHLVGKGVATRSAPVHIGVTVITTSGKEVDLLVHTLFPAAMGEKVQFTADLDEAPRYVLIGAWGTRVEPCESERQGCKEFGFVLDDSIAAFPAGLYTQGMRQRFVPDGLEVQLKPQDHAALDAANAYAGVFGATVKPSDYTGDLGPGVWAAQADDLGMAQSIAEVLKLEYAVSEGLPAPLVVVLPD